MEYITIISKTEILAVPNWMTCIVGGIGIALILSTFVYWAIVRNVDKVGKYLNIVAPIALGILVIWIIVSNLFLSVPTGRYKYVGTIDDGTTIIEWEDPIQ